MEVSLTRFLVTTVSPGSGATSGCVPAPGSLAVNAPGGSLALGCRRPMVETGVGHGADAGRRGHRRTRSTALNVT